MKTGEVYERDGNQRMVHAVTVEGSVWWHRPDDQTLRRSDSRAWQRWAKTARLVSARKEGAT